MKDQYLPYSSGVNSNVSQKKEKSLSQGKYLPLLGLVGWRAVLWEKGFSFSRDSPGCVNHGIAKYTHTLTNPQPLVMVLNESLKV